MKIKNNINFIMIFIIILYIINLTSGNIYIKKATVFASSEYARILNENTPLYCDSNCAMVKFYLPYSYYVKIVSVKENCVRVIYMDGINGLPSMEGYIKTCDFYPCDQTPQNPYPNIYLTVASDEILFLDSNKTQPKTIVQNGNSAFYYGQYDVDGEIFYYVYCKQYVGYIRKSCFTNYVIPLHETPIEIADDNVDSDVASESDQIVVQEKTQSSTTLSSILVISVAFVCICVIYVILKPTTLSGNMALTEKDDKY